METLAYDDWNKLIQGVFITGPALNVLSMELVPPNKEIDWFCPRGAQDPGLRISKCDQSGLNRIFTHSQLYSRM